MLQNRPASQFLYRGVFMKREEKTKLTRERIIAASIDEFGSKGYAMASVNNVCDAGIAKGLIYRPKDT